MIPTNATVLEDFEIEVDNTLTHKLLIDKERILGKADGIEAIKQAVYVMLNVERYDWVIFSPRFGVELKDLFGKPIPYCLSEIKRRIRECLLVDERITEVKDFEFELNKGTVLTTFLVVSNVGEFKQEMEVKV